LRFFSQSRGRPYLPRCLSTVIVTRSLHKYVRAYYGKPTANTVLRKYRKSQNCVFVITTPVEWSRTSGGQGAEVFKQTY